MNNSIEVFARQQIKDGLAKLPDGNVRLFKRMYSHLDLEKPIEKVVDDMPADKLDWALTQIENTIRKHERGEG